MAGTTAAAFPSPHIHSEKGIIMTESAQATVPASAPPAAASAPGFFERMAEHLVPHAEHAGAEAGTIAADVKAALTDHASEVFDVSGDLLALLKLVDPADAALAEAVAALVPKVVSMASSAASIASAALKAA
jgi:hypothetical protein